MTKADLIRAIVEKCRASSLSRRSGPGDVASRSPAAGGGLADSEATLPRSRRRAPIDPQTGDLAPRRRRRTRAGRRG